MFMQDEGSGAKDGCEGWASMAGKAAQALCISGGWRTWGRAGERRKAWEAFYGCGRQRNSQDWPDGGLLEAAAAQIRIRPIKILRDLRWAGCVGCVPTLYFRSASGRLSPDAVARSSDGRSLACADSVALQRRSCTCTHCMRTPLHSRSLSAFWRSLSGQTAACTRASHPRLPSFPRCPHLRPPTASCTHRTTRLTLPIT